MRTERVCLTIVWRRPAILAFSATRSQARAARSSTWLFAAGASSTAPAIRGSSPTSASRATPSWRWRRDSRPVAPQVIEAQRPGRCARLHRRAFALRSSAPTARTSSAIRRREQRATGRHHGICQSRWRRIGSRRRVSAKRRRREARHQRRHVHRPWLRPRRGHRTGESCRDRGGTGAHARAGSTRDARGRVRIEHRPVLRAG